jgi:hypothetical protein
MGPDAATIQGRLMGTTANPQHAAVLLAISLLGPAYFLMRSQEFPKWAFWSAIGLCILITHCLILTGSRTGLGVAMIGTGILLRRRFSTNVLVGSAVAVVAAVLLKDTVFSDKMGRLASVEDTRTAVWTAQWNSFLQHPFWGRPEMGRRFRTGENSWLGMMEATGMLGLSALLLLLIRGGASAGELYRFSKQQYRRDDVDFCLAGLLAIFAGSFFEAYLLGVITMPILFIAMLSVCCEQVIKDCRRFYKAKRGEGVAARRQMETYAVSRTAGAGPGPIAASST